MLFIPTSLRQYPTLKGGSELPSKTSVSKIFEVPKFYYFESKNDYSGSVGDFAYKIKYGENLTASNAYTGESKVIALTNLVSMNFSSSSYSA